MLFNSFAFLLGFLPFALAVHWLAERFAPAWRLPVSWDLAGLRSVVRTIVLDAASGAAERSP